MKRKSVIVGHTVKISNERTANYIGVGYVPEMDYCLGKTGVVTDVYGRFGETFAIIDFGDYIRWTFNIKDIVCEVK